MKLCKECDNYNGKIALKECGAPENITKLDRVNGEMVARWSSCEVLRDDCRFFAWLFGMCGKDARWFKPKESEGK